MLDTMQNKETDFTDFIESVQKSARPILLANFAGGLYWEDNFKEIEEFRKQFVVELDIFVASKNNHDLYARAFDIGGYPVFILFYLGKEIARFHGSANRKELGEFYMNCIGRNR